MLIRLNKPHRLLRTFSSPQCPSGGHSRIRKISGHSQETRVLLVQARAAQSMSSAGPRGPKLLRLLWKQPGNRNAILTRQCAIRATSRGNDGTGLHVSVKAVSVTYGRGCDTKPGRALRWQEELQTCAALDVLKWWITLRTDWLNSAHKTLHF